MDVDELVRRYKLTDAEIEEAIKWHLEQGDGDPCYSGCMYPMRDVAEAQCRKLIPFILMEVGIWLDAHAGIKYADAPDEPMRGFVSLDIREADIESLKRGEMPKR